MTSRYNAGGPAGDPGVCGAMTSGGTESILTAVKASRDYMRAKRGIRHPEMVIGRSAHAAFFKAAEYFKIKLVVVGALAVPSPCMSRKIPARLCPQSHTLPQSCPALSSPACLATALPMLCRHLHTLQTVLPMLLWPYIWAATAGMPLRGPAETLKRHE